MPQSTENRVAKVRTWVRFFFRDVASPCMGFGLLGFEAIYEHADRPWLILASLTLLGYPVADRIDGLLKGGGGNGRKGGNGVQRREDEADTPTPRPRTGSHRR